MLTSDNDDDNSEFSDDDGYLIIEDVHSYGCEHYLRKCQIISPCCNNIYSCRLCHDENETHKINRFDISEVICSECNKKQKVKQYCESCEVCFGKYYCDICHLFDDNNKKQFHCYGCGFCRIGGKDNFIHCDKCNMCVPKTLYDNHKCLNIIEYMCPICMEELFTSRIGVVQLKCGHYIHNTCLHELLHTSYKCPMCSGSIIVVDEYNQLLDEEIEAIEMPEEYRDMMIDILCNDCHEKSNVKFHIIGLKCGECGGYNTRRI